MLPPMAALVYQPRKEFIPFHNRTERWASMNTHRRAGKTVALANDVIYGALQCRLRKPQLAYIGPTYTQAKRIAWTYLKDYAEPYLSKPPQESELKLTLKNDATIHVLGADNADALRGMYLDGTVNDEYALWRPSVFSQVIRPALSDRNGWSVFASTPRGKNLFYDIQRKAEASDEWFSLTLKASTSGIISPQELEALRRQMDPEEFAQEYECSFDAALKGAIYASEVDLMFKEGRFRTTELSPLFDPDLETHVVYDLGFTDATVSIWWQVHRDGRLVIVKCEATTGVDIFHHIAELHNFPGEIGEVWLPHDGRAKNLQTGKSVVEQFLSEGIRPNIVPNHKIRDGISAARKIFPSVVIEEATTGELIEALKGYRREWNEDLGMFSDRPVHDWCSNYADAFRYFAIVAGNPVNQIKTGAPTKKNEYHLENLFADHLARQRQTAQRIS
jgi:phage terminase large subunit